MNKKVQIKGYKFWLFILTLIVLGGFLQSKFPVFRTTVKEKQIIQKIEILDKYNVSIVTKINKFKSPRYLLYSPGDTIIINLSYYK